MSKFDTAWRDLGITRKFSLAFGVMLGLVLLVIITSYLALTITRQQMINSINEGLTVQQLVSAIERDLQAARHFQSEFFLTYPEIGLESAKRTYAQNANIQLQEVLRHTQALQSHFAAPTISDEFKAIETEFRIYRTVAEINARTFDELVRLITELENEEDGLIPQLDQTTNALRRLLLEAGADELIDTYQEILILENEYRAVRRREVMEAALVEADTLEAALINREPAIPGYQRDIAIGLLNRYRNVARQVVRIDGDVRRRRANIALQMRSVTPTSLKLRQIAEIEISNAQTRIEQINQAATIFWVVMTLLSIGIALRVARLLNESVTQNVLKLTSAAQQLKSGQLDVVAKVDSHDELGELAETFNEMAIQLHTLVENLEQRVLDRTRRLSLVAELGANFKTILDVDQLLTEIVNQIKAHFDYYQASIYLLNDAQTTLKLAAGTGEIGLRMKGEVFQIDLNITSLTTKAFHTGKAVLVDDVRLNPDWMSSKFLPDTCSEIAVPIFSDERVIGVLNVQSDRLAGLDDSDVDLLRSLANQIGIAVANARLYTLLQQANQELTTINTNKDKFFSIVAHDLKGPFMPLLGSAELLYQVGDTLSQQQVRDLSGAIYRSAQTTYALLEDLLEWARMQMGRVEYNPTTVKLEEVAQQTVKLFTPVAERKEIRLASTLPTDLMSHADVNMVDTVIRNLTNNALKFTPALGRVEIRGRQLDGRWVEVTISDTGVGMTAETQANLFDVGQTRSTNGTDNESGTGLGLVMCREMVELHGGRIWVESEVGRGTTVKFTLPRATAPTR